MTRKKRLARRAERKRKLRVVEKVTDALRGELVSQPSQSQFRQFRTPVQTQDDLMDATRMVALQFQVPRAMIVSNNPNIAPRFVDDLEN